MFLDLFSADVWLLILAFAGGTLRALRNRPTDPGPALIGSLTSTLAVVLGVIGYCDYSGTTVELWMACLGFMAAFFGSELLATVESRLKAQLAHPTWVLKLLPPFLTELFTSKPNDTP